ncbi:CASTOR/POLLUX-related putative ion channel [Actinomadura mexicana]|uniref:Castor and Pollux, part of voltage-gated ion channel n=1 Tax=Actinomadura mexicana TaxID=134959 RepID=A0A238XVP4_9ACTN|nr:potassium transporter TrkA [Actinomadura mexicana]SNR62802.1 Castor and Pollux, part of voltage-gated ion channel [Actinomadura mexicana]
MTRVTRRDRVRYWFDRTMSKGTPALIGWLGLASGALVLVVATAAVVIAPDDSESNGHWPGMVWRSLLRTLDPGTMGDDAGTAPFLGLMLVSTIGGIFIVSSLIGVLTTGLESKITELRKGRSRIVEHDHTVLLGWSEQVFTVVAELVEANQSRRRSCVAILADRDKVEMEDAIRARVGDLGRTRIVCRTGDPLKVADVELVSPGTARSIMVVAPEVEESDARVIKVLLSLGARPWGRGRPHVVAAVHDSANLPAARLAGGPAAHVIDADDVAIRLIVQSHRQSGLSQVCTDLLDFAGHEFYMRAEPALAGMPFGASLSAYDLGVPAGLRRADGTVLLNPPMDTAIRSDDEVIVLAEDDLLIRLATGPAPPVREAAITTATARHPVAERTLMLGWNHRAPKIIELLDEFLAPDSALVVAAPREDPTGALPPATNLRVDFVRAEPTERPALESLDLGSFQRVIVLSDARQDREHADARTLVTLLHLRDIEDGLGDPFAIVSEINDDANREIAQVTKADDFVVSEKLISLMLTQLSENRHLYEVFADLLDPAGSEIYLKPACDYLAPDAEADFATLIESARRRGEVALGYRLTERFHEPPGYGVVLNPDKTAPLTLSADDRVIVLAEN